MLATATWATFRKTLQIYESESKVASPSRASARAEFTGREHQALLSLAGPFHCEGSPDRVHAYVVCEQVAAAADDGDGASAEEAEAAIRKPLLDRGVGEPGDTHAKDAGARAHRLAAVLEV